MSTRCTLTVRDRPGANQTYSVYRHSDGYPDTEHGVIHTLRAALSYAWLLPRFEADDFAAAIIATWKQPATRHSATYVGQGGNIRMTEGRDAHGDTEYHYELMPDAKGRVKITVYEPDGETWKKVGKVHYLTATMQTPVPAVE